MGIFSYTITHADILSTIEIPATMIDIQDGKKILQFDLSDIDTGRYDSIENIAIHMAMVTKKHSIDMETLRNNTRTSIGQTNVMLTLGLNMRKKGENIRDVDIENLS